MSGTSLSIAIKADQTDLQTNLALANANLRTHSAEVRKLAAAAGKAGDAMRDQFVQQLRAATVETSKASSEVAKLKSELKGAGEERGLLATFDALKGRFASMANMGGEIREFAEAFLAAFAVERVAEWVNQITEAGAKVQHLSQQLGMTTQEVSKLGFTAQAMGIGVDQTASMLEKLERASVEAGDGTSKTAKAFADLGISTADLKNSSPEDLLNKMADAFARTADGPAKTAIAIALMGRAGADLIPVLDQGSAGLKSLSDGAERAGVVLTGPMAEGMESTSVNTNEMMQALKGVSLTLYEAFKPALDAAIGGITEVTEGFNNWIKGTSVGHDVLTAITVIIDGVVAAIETFSFALKESYELAATCWKGMGDDAEALGGVLRDVFTGKWGEISHDWKLLLLQMDTDNAATLTKMANDATEYATSMKALYSNIGANGVDTSGGADQPGKNKPKIDASNLEQGGDSQKSQVDAWQAALTQKLLSQQLFGEKAKAYEVSYWEGILATIKGAGAEQIAERAEINEKLYGLESELHEREVSSASAAARKMSAELRSASLDDMTTAIAAAKSAAEATRSADADKLASGQITHTQLVGLNEQTAQQEYQTDLNALQDELLLNNLSVADRARINDEILKLEAQHTADMAKLNSQMALAIIKDYDDTAAELIKTQTAAAKQWQAAIEPVARNFDTMLESMLERRESFNAVMLKLAQQLTNSLIGFASKELVHWISTELAKSTATQTGVAIRTATQASGAAAGRAIDAASGSASVLGDAHKAFAGTYAALAGIPVVGPFIAPVAAGAAYTAVAAMDIFSASEGFNIPSGINPMTQLHENEMVLPAHLANPFRDMVSNQTTFGGTSSSHSFATGDIHVHQQPGQDGRAMWDAIKGHMSNDMRNGWRPSGMRFA